ncbi:hypothetical protein EDC94DRAFT_521562, partial [Helicostylum pulchrum]
IHNLKTKLGPNAVQVFGDWSSPNVIYQEPTRNKAPISMLKKNGFVVYMINELRCPPCEKKNRKL